MTSKQTNRLNVIGILYISFAGLGVLGGLINLLNAVFLGGGLVEVFMPGYFGADSLILFSLAGLLLAAFGLIIGIVLLQSKHRPERIGLCRGLAWADIALAIVYILALGVFQYFLITDILTDLVDAFPRDPAFEAGMNAGLMVSAVLTVFSQLYRLVLPIILLVGLRGQEQVETANLPTIEPQAIYHTTD